MLFWAQIPAPWRVVFCVLLGLAVGIFVLFVRASRAHTYMGSDPLACVNCHVMDTQFATWSADPHRRHTNCLDCHLPHDSLVSYWITKAKDGMKDTWLYLAGLETNMALASPHTRDIAQANCLRCHHRLLDETAWGQFPLAMGRGGSGRQCLDCHRHVPHGTIKGRATVPQGELVQRARPLPPWLDKILTAEQQGASK